ncbi:MAG TPA: hypothetical protein PK433_03620, partial [Candidatus Cloacimonadota bacterium]|nr:hypothetical protein [Candidatus Cloacimonadota bacterium]HOR58628.1 hypothetical protein [Candidatus Cloacimonadota bacterium]
SCHYFQTVCHKIPKNAQNFQTIQNNPSHHPPSLYPNFPNFQTPCPPISRYEDIALLPSRARVVWSLF